MCVKKKGDRRNERKADVSSSRLETVALRKKTGGAAQELEVEIKLVSFFLGETRLDRYQGDGA